MSSPARLALSTVGIAAFLFATKMAAAVASDSIGALSTAIDSGLDLLISLVVLAGVVLARRPADREHPYGHGKFENVAGLIEAGILAGTGVLLGWSGYQRMVDPAPIHVTGWVIGVMVVAIILDAERAWRLFRGARRHRSPAFRVDAWHFASDLVTTAVVLVGLLMASRSDALAWADGGSALVVAAFLIVGSIHVGWTTAAALTDRVPPRLMSEIERAVHRVPGVAGAADVRVRQAGADVFVDATIPVSRALSLEEAHDVADAVERAVREEVDGADVVVHPEPIAHGEDPATTVKVLAARHAGVRGIHEIRVNDLPEGRIVDCHIEVGDVTVAEAHRIADDFERIVRSTVPRVFEVCTHLEVAADEPRPGRDVTAGHPEVVEAVHAAVAACPLEGPRICNVFDVGDNLEVHVVALAPSGMLLSEAHDRAEALERRVLEDIEPVVRAVVHVEPA